MTIGAPRYAPVTTKYVPKYFAPIEALEILIANPMNASARPRNTNGERIRIRSEYNEQMMTVAARRIREVNGDKLIRPITYSQQRKEGQTIAGKSQR